MVENLFSVDVEDWFHLLDNHRVPDFSRWTIQESRVHQNVERILDELAKNGTTATFFILGWVAEHHPGVVRSIADRGHEIASHGYSHALVYEQTPSEFRDDLKRAGNAIHEAAGVWPVGYRAPGFSIKRDNLWAFDVLREEGFLYDSSSFPAVRAHCGLPGAEHLPHRLSNGLVEIPISTVKLGPGRCGYLGGGYLRLLPEPLLMRIARTQAQAGTPLVLYVHPRDYDPRQPRIQLPPHQRYRAYVGLGTCMAKIKQLLSSFEWGTFGSYAAQLRS